MKWKNALKMLVIWLLLIVGIRITLIPFYYWCVNLYEDTVWIVETMRYGDEKMLWLDNNADLFEKFKPYAGDNSSGMTDRILPE